MEIVYDSMTGNVRRFIRKTGFEARQVQRDLIVDEPFILVCYTIGLGNPPKKTQDFLKNNHHNLIGVAVSGNTNFGWHHYCRAADVIAEKYNVPILLKFELAGNQDDIDNFIERVQKLEKSH